MRTDVCPDRELLSSHLLGRVHGPQANWLDQHLQSCNACQQALEELNPQDELTNDLLDSAPGPEGHEQQIEAIIQRGIQLQGEIETVKTEEALAITQHEQAASKSMATGDIETDFLGPPEHPDEIGRLGGYRVFEVMGAGGMGIVFRAEDTKLKRQVALKAMKPTVAASNTSKDRFLREAQAAAAIEHDNIVPIYQVGEDRGIPFIAMRYLRGQSLQGLLAEKTKIDQKEAVRIAQQIAAGLAAAHERGLIHRDIKPDNVWLEADTKRAKILDFGLVRSHDEDTGLTKSGMVLGTPKYMSPEQAKGEDVDHRCDLFSLGSVLYQLVSGKAPFDGGNLTATLMAVSQADCDPIEEVCPELDSNFADLITRLLSKQKEDRPQNATEVMQSLSIIESNLKQTRQLSETTELTSDASAASSIPPRRRISVAVAVGGFLLSALLLAAITIAIKTPEGTVYLRIDGNNERLLDLNISDDNTVTLNDPNDGKPITITIDRQNKTLILSKDRFKVTTTGFSLQLKNQTLDVSFEPIKSDKNDQESPLVVKRDPKPRPKEPPSPLGTWVAGKPNGTMPGIATRPVKVQGIRGWQVYPKVPVRVSNVAYSSDDKYVAISTQSHLHDGSVYVYESPPIPENLRLVIPANGQAISWHPSKYDFSVVDTVSTDPTKRKVCTFSIEGKRSWSKTENAIQKIALAPDGKSLVCASSYHTTITLLNGETGERIRSVDLDSTPGTRVAWSEDGTHVVALSKSGKLYHWSAADGSLQVIREGLDVPASGDQRCAFSQSGKWFATVGDSASEWTVTDSVTSKQVSLTDIKTFTPRRTRASFSPGENLYVMIGSEYGANHRTNLACWQLPSGKLLWKKTLNRPPRGVLHPFWSLNGDSLVIADAETQHFLRTFDARTGEPRERMAGLGGHTSACWNSASNRLFFTATDNQIRAWDQTQQSIKSFVSGFDSQPHAVDLSHDDKRIAVAVQHAEMAGGTVQLFDLPSKKKIAELASGTEYTAMRFDRSGRYLAAREQLGGPLHVRDLETQQTSSPIVASSSSIAWRGDVTAFFNDSRLVELRNPAQGELGTRLDLPAMQSARDSFLDVSPFTGKLAVADGKRGRVSLFDENNQPCGEIVTNDLGPIAWHPSEDLLMVCEGHYGTRLRGWDTRGNPVPTSFQCDLPHGANRLRWSPDGQLICIEFDARQDQRLLLVRFPDMQHHGNLYSFPNGSAALIAPTGEVVVQDGEATDQLVCVVEDEQYQYTTYSYGEFVSKFGVKINKRTDVASAPKPNPTVRPTESTQHGSQSTKISAERQVAEWVIGIGGSVRTRHGGPYIHRIEGLPTDPFQ